MRQKVMSGLLAFCLLAALLPAGALAASPDVWDGTVAESFAGGSGTEADPYRIATGAQLAYLAQVVNQGDEAYNAAYYELTADIDLGGIDAWGNGVEDRQWTPIGRVETKMVEEESVEVHMPFRGHFQGNGRMVSGLYVNREENYAGLFGYISGGTVQSVRVSGSVSGDRYTGGIAGESYRGTIRDVWFSGSVSGTYCVGGIAGSSEAGSASGALVTNCRNDASVSGKGDVGGVVGFNQASYAGSNTAEVSCCVNTGSVFGQYDDVGGVTGCNEVDNKGTAWVTRCMNAGLVKGGGRYIGGVAGHNHAKKYGSATVSNSYNTGTVTWLPKSGNVSNNGKFVGGVVGRNYAETSGVSSGSYPSVSISSCYSVGPVDGRDYVYGVAYSSHSGGTIPYANVTGCRFLQTDTVNVGLSAAYKGNGRESDNKALSVSDFSTWDSFSDWDRDIWTMGTDLDPFLSVVTARPVLKDVAEPILPRAEMTGAVVADGVAAVRVLPCVPARAVCGAYDADGRCLGVELRELKADEDTALSFSLPDDAKTVRFFVLDEGMRPLAACEELPVK